MYTKLFLSARESRTQAFGQIPGYPVQKIVCNLLNNFIGLIRVSTFGINDNRIKRSKLV